MCFSPDADLAAGVVVTVIGVDAIRRARTPKELPLAALPLLFGIHQLVEAFVWWGLAGTVPSRVGDAATWLYLAVAFALPFWVPTNMKSLSASVGSFRRRSSARSLRGTRCAFLAFMRSAGTVHTFALKSISSHFAPMTC